MPIIFSQPSRVFHSDITSGVDIPLLRPWSEIEKEWDEEFRCLFPEDSPGSEKSQALKEGLKRSYDKAQLSLLEKWHKVQKELARSKRESTAKSTDTAGFRDGSRNPTYASTSYRDTDRTNTKRMISTNLDGLTTDELHRVSRFVKYLSHNAFSEGSGPSLDLPENGTRFYNSARWSRTQPGSSTLDLTPTVALDETDSHRSARSIFASTATTSQKADRRANRPSNNFVSIMSGVSLNQGRSSRATMTGYPTTCDGISQQSPPSWQRMQRSKADQHALRRVEALVSEANSILFNLDEYATVENLAIKLALDTAAYYASRDQGSKHPDISEIMEMMSTLCSTSTVDNSSENLTSQDDHSNRKVSWADLQFDMPMTVSRK